MTGTKKMSLKSKQACTTLTKCVYLYKTTNLKYVSHTFSADAEDCVSVFMET